MKIYNTIITTATAYSGSHPGKIRTCRIQSHINSGNHITGNKYIAATVLIDIDRALFTTSTICSSIQTIVFRNDPYTLIKIDFSSQLCRNRPVSTAVTGNNNRCITIKIYCTFFGSINSSISIFRCCCNKRLLADTDTASISTINTVCTIPITFSVNN